MSEVYATNTEIFAGMQGRLLVRGAGNTAISGTVVDADVFYRAAYHVDTSVEPPVVSQLLISPTGKSTVLTRLTVSGDEPRMAVSMHEPFPGTDPAFQLQTMLEATGLSVEAALPELTAGEHRNDPFLDLYGYVRGFEPDVS
jgi:hypothetical protein